MIRFDVGIMCRKEKLGWNDGWMFFPCDADNKDHFDFVFSQET